MPHFSLVLRYSFYQFIKIIQANITNYPPTAKPMTIIYTNPADFNTKCPTIAPNHQQLPEANINYAHI